MQSHSRKLTTIIAMPPRPMISGTGATSGSSARSATRSNMSGAPCNWNNNLQKSEPCARDKENTLTMPYPKKVLIALPPAMLQRVDEIAGNEHRTRSDLIREALRRYMQEFDERVLARIDRQREAQQNV